ncbi:MAG TPA: DEAD/DEAH box helicase [Thermoplasmata archaeon]|nr:DEAD/DEAH box helicase [Thermoplasmata archaeon]
MKYISHPLIKSNAIEIREYQQNIGRACLNHNTLVILPTALGKTVISLLVAVNRLDKKPESKIFVLAPTRPLTLQHYESFKQFLALDEEKFVALTGKISPEKRSSCLKNAQIIFATPQLIRNDILKVRYDLSNVSLVVFDEAHRARKKYAYNQIAAKYMDQSPDPLILGLTASPGKDWKTIRQTCKSLFIDALEYRTEKDKDVKPYVPPLEMSWKRTELSGEYKEIRGILEEMFHQEIEKLQSMGILTYKRAKQVTKRDLLELGKRLRRGLEKGGRGSLYAAVVFQSAAISITHAIELLTTQDILVLYRFLKKTEEKKAKSARRLVRKPEYEELIRKVEGCLSIEHPKLALLREAIEEEYLTNKDTRIIVFTQFRDTATRIIQSLEGLEIAKPVRFVGQASKPRDPGLKQAEQSEILKEFREGRYNVLVATSIAEEGLDIPTVDLVIFYEPIPSEIRYIQRKGRTARRRLGRVVILITKGTVDESYYWSSRARERKMRKIIYSLNQKFMRAKGFKEDLFLEKRKQKTLEEFE